MSVSASSKPILGKYRILKEIARTSNIVYEGIDPGMGKRVAIKELLIPENSTELQKQDRITRFLREAKAAGQLNHPNIVSIYDVGEHEHRYFIVMEYLEGENLRAYLKKYGSLPVNKVIPMAIQLGEALSYAHARGVVHRDVKPDNVHLQPRGIIKLTDFGTAKVQADISLTADGHAVGTPYYMSPEQVLAKPVDRRTDIFSLGIMLYELITGFRPFQGETIAEITRNIVSSTPPMPAGTTIGLQNILQRALAKDLNMRYQTVEMLIADLKAEKAASEAAAGGSSSPVITYNSPLVPAPVAPVGPVSVSEPPPVTPNPSKPTPTLEALFAQPPGVQQSGTADSGRAGRPTPSGQPAVPGPPVITGQPNNAVPMPSALQPAAPVSRSPLFIVLVVATVLLAGSLAGYDYLYLTRQPSNANSSQPASPQTAAAPLPAASSSSPAGISTVYDGALKGGWQDWSYNDKVNYANTTPTHGDPHSIAVTMTKPYGALSFHLDGFNPALYNNVSFWLNGGTKGCPKMVLQGVVNDKNPATEQIMDVAPPNTWIHVSMPVKDLGLVPGAHGTGFWIQDKSGNVGQTWYVDQVELTKR